MKKQKSTNLKVDENNIAHKIIKIKAEVNLHF